MRSTQLEQVKAHAALHKGPQEGFCREASGVWLILVSEAASMQQCARHRWHVQVVADSDNDLEVGVFLGAYRQLAQRQDLETRRLCAESCTAVLKAATPRRSAATGLQGSCLEQSTLRQQWQLLHCSLEQSALLLSVVAVVALNHCPACCDRKPV